MTTKFYLAPAATGKTTYALDRVRQAAQGLASTPRVVVPSHLQASAWRRRLASAGGAIGVQISTFDGLYAACLSDAAEIYTLLSEPVQYRLLRTVVDDLGLVYYAPLTQRPGFVQVVQRLIAELKAARVEPENLERAMKMVGEGPRLVELAQIYAAYQARLQDQGWADFAGLGWLAVEALEQRATTACHWPLLVVDGFDSFTPVQIDLLRALGGRVAEMVVTLTGSAGGEGRPLVYRRFDKARRMLEEALEVEAEPLPQQGTPTYRAPALAHLEANLFRTGAVSLTGVADADGVQVADRVEVVDRIEAPDREAEVRAALRWLKTRLVADKMEPAEVALLARNISPYRSLILQTAAEFRMPVRVVDGLPLGSNPSVAALLDLLRLVLPRSSDDPEPALPRRLVLEAWRSPYFACQAMSWGQDEAGDEGLAQGGADLLDAVARWGRVIGGRAQWFEALDHLSARSPEDKDAARSEIPAGVPVGKEAQVLRTRFRRFVDRLTPPLGLHTYRTYVGWFEALIGPDPDEPAARKPQAEAPPSLDVVCRMKDGEEGTAGRDVAALCALKEILRGLVWAEEALTSGEPPRVPFSRFFEELAGAVEAAIYQIPSQSHGEEIIVADVVQARGVLFRAVAVLGLAESEFPATLSEDTFLRDADRQRLREGFGLPLEPSLESAEAEFFYETVGRPSERLLLTRPRLAENGAPWQASPYWEEVGRLLPVEPQTLFSHSLPSPAEVASWPELMESLAARGGQEEVRRWVTGKAPDRRLTVDAAAHILGQRQAGAGSEHDGDLTHLAPVFGQALGPARSWSASRLEAYRTCPFFYFVGSVLGLEPREDPVEGLDARQLGNIYHHIFEGVYQDPEVSDAGDLAQLLAALPRVAAAVLDEAPQREGFRQTAWWRQTREEIVENVRLSLEALDALPGGFVPVQHEMPFGLRGWPPLTVVQKTDRFSLRGFVDRVDRAADGRLRIIDYKTGSKWAFTNRSVVEGKKLQLPLYALAVRDALALGEPAEGFYWHVRQAEPSSFTLAGFEGGPQAAMDVAVEKAWEAVRGARDGYFVPHPPDGGCPGYCPAADFCWHYQPGFGG